MSYQRPANPALARVFDEAIRKGHEIRYADETQVVTWQRNQLGCAGLIILILLGIITAFIVPIILLVLGALSPSGQVTTFTLQPNGKLKKKQRAAKK